MQVFKFGGASVKDAESVKNVVDIVRQQAKEPTLMVISAMGKTTNKLEEIVKAYFYKVPNIANHIDELKQFHVALLNQLFPNPNHVIYQTIENVFVEIYWAVEEEPSGTFHFHYDQIVSLGEILSTHIVSSFLNDCGLKNKWLDVRGIIQTDNTYREGKVDFELSETLASTQVLPELLSKGLIVTQGFIGGTSENYTTTLGREGSDYTAALLAYFLNAKHVIIWKDVPGVLNADPKYFKNTHKIDELTYHDAIELTYYGASVIHPKTIKPLQNKSIPLYVKSFLNPKAEGTLIVESNKRLNVTSYIFKENQILLSIQPKDFSFIAEDNLSAIFALFAHNAVKVNTMQNSALSFSVCVDDDAFKIPSLLEALQKEFKVLYNRNVQLLTVRHYNAEIISQLTENKVVLLEQRSRTTLQMVLNNQLD